MPATRRTRTTASGPSALLKGSQKTLSFSNKVTKNTKPLGKDKTKIIEADTKPVISVETNAPDNAVEVKQAAEEEEVEEREEVTRATKISDAQIKKYWKARENERIAPRGSFIL